MEPRIQYATTEDGVSIAFTTVGKGPPLVVAGDISDSHVQLVWDTPLAPFFRSLASKQTVVKFDPRGFGLSDRDVDEFSLASRTLNLKAVVDHLGLSRFTLLGIGTGGPLAVTFAAQNPERVSNLALVGSCARTAEIVSRHRASQVRTLIQTDWEMFLENLAAVNTGYGRAETAGMAEFLAATVQRETFVRWSFAIVLDDVTSLLGSVRCPTIIVHYTGIHYLTHEMARELASKIQGSQLMVLEGGWLDVMREAAEGILEFLDEGEEAPADAEAPEAGAFRTILFTDVEGSTVLTDRLGDAKARDLLREHERIVREALKTHGGSEVKTMGDGFMASFSSATKALECAIAIQQSFAEHNDAADEPIVVRVGLNAGEPIAEDDDLFGTAVIAAARIAAKAQGSEILTSDTVRGIVAGKNFLFSDRGDVALRGFEDPMRLYEMSWQQSE